MASQQQATTLGSVLVVGGCGFLGHHIVSQLLESYSAEVSVLDLRVNKNRFPRVSYHAGDITSPTDVRSVLEAVRPQIIIHTASPPMAAGDGDYSAFYEKVNVGGTRNLLECAGQAGCVKAFVYTSSASIIHDTVSDLVYADESWPVLRFPVQREKYSHTKGIADDVVLAANRKYGDMLTTCIRPAGIFGEGDVQMTPGMLAVYDRGLWRVQMGNNENQFDFTYVGNVAHAHILAAVALMNTHARSTPPSSDERVDGEAFFITNDQPYKFWDFTRAIWAAAGHPVDPKDVWVIPKGLGLLIATLIEWIFWIVFLGTRRPNLTRDKFIYSTLNRTYCIDKAKARLGYGPQVGINEGIERAVKWCENERRRKTEMEKKVE
ncbi:MAG: erg26, C-3 sterol dehydrogenase [Peltula sp. TS41687]|nr:MAG: erg26, C-3 sterol dehydrogenase [Peltula sp. TS41687]